MFLTFNHVIACFNTLSFLGLNKIPCVDVQHFVYLSSVDRYLICFYFWIIVTSTALKFLCKYLKTCFSILWIYTKGVKLMGGICGSAGKRI